jgi:hypothetical protein
MLLRTASRSHGEQAVESATIIAEESSLRKILNTLRKKLF